MQAKLSLDTYMVNNHPHGDKVFMGKWNAIFSALWKTGAQEGFPVLSSWWSFCAENKKWQMWNLHTSVGPSSDLYQTANLVPQAPLYPPSSSIKEHEKAEGICSQWMLRHLHSSSHGDGSPSPPEAEKGRALEDLFDAVVTQQPYVWTA